MENQPEKSLENSILEKEICTICLNEDISDEITYRTNCSHIFCKQCLEDWFTRGNDNCPLCRSQVTHYESEGTQYRLIMHNPNNPNNNVETITGNSLVLIRRLSLVNYRLQNFSLFVTISMLLLYEYFLGYINSYQGLSDDYDMCMKNSSRLTDNLNMCLDELNNPVSGTYVEVFDGHKFKECFYPSKYFNQCFSD